MFSFTRKQKIRLIWVTPLLALAVVAGVNWKFLAEEFSSPMICGPGGCYETSTLAKGLSALAYLVWDQMAGQVILLTVLLVEMALMLAVFWEDLQAEKARKVSEENIAEVVPAAVALPEGSAGAASEEGEP